jgi:hypothetical protein
MGRVRFVKPEVVRIPLTDGDWVDVKKRLTVGEARRATQSFVGHFNADGSRTPNMELLGMGMVLAYVVDWSFVDAQDKRVSVSLDAIKNLDQATYSEIDEAISAHVEAVEREDSDREKKASGESAPSATS